MEILLIMVVLAYSYIQSTIWPKTPLINQSIHSFIHSFIHSIHSFHSFIHSFKSRKSCLINMILRTINCQHMDINWLGLCGWWMGTVLVITTTIINDLFNYQRQMVMPNTVSTLSFLLFVPIKY